MKLYSNINQLGKLITLIVILSIAILFGLNLQVKALSASDWQAGRIIDDSTFTKQDMSAADIQNFLNSKVPICDTWGTLPAKEFGRADISHAQYAALVGWPDPPYVCLKDFHEVPKITAGQGIPINSFDNGGNPPPGSISAAQMIYNAAYTYNISPKVLLVKLGTESLGPLTSDTWPLKKQYTYAMGAHVPDSGPGGTANPNTDYAGFSIQISESARLLRAYLDNMQQSWWDNKKPYQNNDIFWNVETSGCGASPVYMQNKATTALYVYTPYQPNAAALANMYGTGDGCSAYGNRNFWSTFNNWFGSTIGYVTAPPSNIQLPNGVYTFNSTISAQSIDVAGGQKSIGGVVQLYSSNGTNAQKWELTLDNDGYYNIVNVESGLYLDAQSGGTSNGTRLQTWSGNGTCAQKWSIQLKKAGYEILNKCSSKAIDIPSALAYNGNRLHIWDANNSGAQIWDIVSTNNDNINGIYEISSPSGLALDLTGGNTSNGTKLQIWQSNGTAAQIWSFNKENDGFYTIKNPLSNKYLDVLDAKTIEGTSIQIFEKNISCAQKWEIKKIGTSEFTIRSACSSLVLDVQGGAINNLGSNIQLWSNNDTSAQKWTLTPKIYDLKDGNYSLKSNSGLALDLTGGNTSNGTKLQIWQSNGTAAQIWSFNKTNDGYYTIKNINSDKQLDLPGASAFRGNPIQLWSPNLTCAQKWKLLDAGGGKLVIQSSCYNNAAFDVAGGNTNTPGTKVQIYSLNATPAQQWYPELINY